VDVRLWRVHIKDEQTGTVCYCESAVVRGKRQSADFGVRGLPPGRLLYELGDSDGPDLSVVGALPFGNFGSSQHEHCDGSQNPKA